MEARLVQLEGIDVPCLLLAPAHSMPDEIQIDVERLAGRLHLDKKGTVTWRLQPSSVGDDEPVYLEVFDE